MNRNYLLCQQIPASKLALEMQKLFSFRGEAPRPREAFCPRTPLWATLTAESHAFAPHQVRVMAMAAPLGGATGL
jgi:hypothetical protein